jgi:uncharacterized protein (DUF433 family)
MNWQEHIHSDPMVLLGKPTIKGTRLSVELILELFEQGWTKERILESYPKLSDKSIKAVFDYLKECLQVKLYPSIEDLTLSEAHESAGIYGSNKVQKKPFNPDDFLGIMSYPIEFLDSEIKKMRNEWDRDI